VTLSIEYATPGSLAIDATSVAAKLGWSKTYDAEYVALARRLDCCVASAASSKS
jgi:predicted nucleic acid-binding protein